METPTTTERIACKKGWNHKHQARKVGGRTTKKVSSVASPAPATYLVVRVAMTRPELLFFDRLLTILARVRTSHTCDFVGGERHHTW